MKAQFRLFALFCLSLGAVVAATNELSGRWSEERANAWYATTPWPSGADYLPRSAINQLEMWQADTFNPTQIDQELGWAAGVGFNTMRVFLHDLLWQQDATGFLQRMDQYLAIADRHGIKTIFVFFDGVWDPNPYLGKQRAPRFRVHNSGWVQSPGRDILGDPARLDELKPYVVGVLRHFKDDKRVLCWDLFNEPDNLNTTAYGKLELPDKPEAALRLLKKVFAWAREVNPAQPLTAGIWNDYEGWKKNPPIFQFMLANADVITFHNYALPEDMKREAVELKAAFHRPVICSEYMQRGGGSTFDPILGDLKKLGVGAINWGLVEGKSQTNYPWDSWEKIYRAEPSPWHHDVFRADGTAYSEKEVSYIKSVTGK